MSLIAGAECGRAPRKNPPPDVPGRSRWLNMAAGASDPIQSRRKGTL